MEASNALSTLLQCDSSEPSVVVVRRYTNTPYIPQGSSLLLYLHWALSLGVLPPPNSHWTTYVYADYSPSLTLRWSCLKKGERCGWKCFPPFERLCGKAQMRITTSLTQICCQSLCWPPIPIKKRVPRWSEHWVFTQPSSFYKMSFRPDLSWNVSWPRKQRSWLKDMMIRGSN